MVKKLDPLDYLARELTQKEKRKEVSFKEYLELVKKNPRQSLRSIFQLFYDMVEEYVEKADKEIESDPESIGFVRYDCSRLFIEGADNPFFADTPFANRFVRQTAALKQGAQQNRVYVYEGPSGCGKSTFLNNILRSFENYTNTAAGLSYEIVWELDGNLLGVENEKLSLACPSHDYPILIIPKKYRKEFLKNLIKDSAIKKSIFHNKEYAWLLQSEPCTICRSIFWALFNKIGDLEQVLSMVKVRANQFDRRTGEGVSVFNPGDQPFGMHSKKGFLGNYYSNENVQNTLDKLFGPNTIKFAYSSLAKTNNGIYALMDVKTHNKDRLLELHNVISEGVHRVGEIEERINSLFFALMNPEDMKSIDEDDRMQSFKGRMQENNVTFILEPETEANIYRNIFGESINERFLPRVLENFAKVIISSRMNKKCPPQEGWISDMSEYELYCDKDGLLLRMEFYSNNIPGWLSEKDKKSFTAPVRREIIAEGQNEGQKGFSGRDSIELFRDFYSTYSERDTLINMSNVTEFFKYGISRERRNNNLPERGFLDSLVNSYDYAVLNEVKEALYFSSKNQIEKDILHYLCVTNYDIGDIAKCEHTGEEIEVTAEFLIRMARHLSGSHNISEKGAIQYAKGIQKKYVSVRAKADQPITETPLYEELYKNYMKSLKEKVLEPLVDNKNFPEAIKAFGSEEFNTFDSRLKGSVTRLITNLERSFGYSRQGAKEICLYVVENNLVDKFSPREDAEED